MFKKSLVTIIVLILIFGCGKVAKQVNISDPEPVSTTQYVAPTESNPQEVVGAVQSLSKLYLSGVGVPAVQAEVSEMPESFKVNRAQGFSTCAAEPTLNYPYWYYKTGTKFNGTVLEKVDTMYCFYDARTGGQLFDHAFTVADIPYVSTIHQIDNIEGTYPGRPDQILYRVRYDQLVSKSNGKYIATPFPNSSSWFEYYAFKEIGASSPITLAITNFKFATPLSNTETIGSLDCNAAGVRITASISVVNGIANTSADFMYGDKPMATAQLAGAQTIMTKYYIGKTAQYYYQDIPSQGIEDQATFELDAGTYTGVALDGVNQFGLGNRLKNLRIVNKPGVAASAITITQPLTLSNIDSVWVQGVRVKNKNKIVSPIFNNCTDTQYNP